MCPKKWFYKLKSKFNCNCKTIFWFFPSWLKVVNVPCTYCMWTWCTQLPSILEINASSSNKQRLIKPWWIIGFSKWFINKNRIWTPKSVQMDHFICIFLLAITRVCSPWVCWIFFFFVFCLNIFVILLSSGEVRFGGTFLPAFGLVWNLI